MPLMEIKNRFYSSVLYTGEALTIKELLENAVKDGANLRGANLDGAYLDGAYLDGDIKISKIPIQVSTTSYHVIIFDAHMKIGCKFYSLSEWWGFDDHAIVAMDGKRALEFWRKWKVPLQAICEAEWRS